MLLTLIFAGGLLVNAPDRDADTVHIRSIDSRVIVSMADGTQLDAARLSLGEGDDTIRLSAADGRLFVESPNVTLRCTSLEISPGE